MNVRVLKLMSSRLSIGIAAVAACALVSGCPATAGNGNGGGNNRGPDGEYFGSCTDGGDDELVLLNSSPIEATITIGYPGASPCDETIVTSGGFFTTITITYTSYVLDEVYSFTASAPGVLPSETIRCMVNDIAIQNGIATVDVQLSGLPGAAQQLTISCAGNWLPAP